MPSTKSPSDLQIGSGKIPNGTVSTSALTSVPGSTTASTPPPMTVQSVSSGTALTRVGQLLLVLVDASGGAFSIVLPTAAQVGDVIMFVSISSTTTNIVSLARGGSDTIQGSANSQALVGPLASRTMVRSSLTDWTFQLDMPTIQTVTTSLTLTRGGKERIVLVDASGGAVTVTLPQSALVGDRIIIVKSVTTTNSVTVDGNGGDTIDGRLTTSMNTFLQALTIVRIASGAWATVSETSSVIEVTDTFSLSTVESAKEIHLLVKTSDAAWIAGTKTLTLPFTAQTRVGTVITVSDVDGNAESASIIIASQVLGTTPSGTSSFTLNHNFSTVTLINKAASNWNILDEDRGLVPNFFALSRADSRSDVSQSRFAALPQFNWSHRKVAHHAEFSGIITNILPIEGFSAGGNMILSSTSGITGTVGLMRCTVPTGGSGYMHLGTTPTDNLFAPSQILGFRAILRLNTANPGVNYDFTIGFGDDISDVTGNVGAGTDSYMGTEGLWLGTNGTGFQWRRVRRAASASAGADFGSLGPGNRNVVEYYFDGTNWDGYLNGVRSVGGSTNIPTTALNFGFQLIDTGSVTPTVDIDSITIFTLDLGSTRST